MDGDVLTEARGLRGIPGWREKSSSGETMPRRAPDSTGGETDCRLLSGGRLWGEVIKAVGPTSLANRHLLQGRRQASPGDWDRGLSPWRSHFKELAPRSLRKAFLDCGWEQIYFSERQTKNLQWQVLSKKCSKEKEVTG